MWQLLILSDQQVPFSLDSWLPPPVDYVKSNVDGAIRGNPGRASCGGVINGPNGRFIFGFSKSIGIQSLVFAETFTVLEGLQLVASLHIPFVWIELDSEVLVDCLNEFNTISCSIIHIFACIKHIL